MNFLATSKKANDYLLKYPVFMIHLDKLESLLLKHARNLQDSSPNCGIVWPEFRRTGRSNKDLVFCVASWTTIYEKRSCRKHCTFCWRMPVSFSGFKGISPLGWNDLLFTCHLVQFVMILLYQYVHYYNLEDLFCWQRAVRKLNQNNTKFKKKGK